MLVISNACNDCGGCCCCGCALFGAPLSFLRMISVQIFDSSQRMLTPHSPLSQHTHSVSFVHWGSDRQTSHSSNSANNRRQQQRASNCCCLLEPHASQARWGWWCGRRRCHHQGQAGLRSRGPLPAVPALRGVPGRAASQHSRMAGVCARVPLPGLQAEPRQLRVARGGAGVQRAHAGPRP